MGKSKTVDKLKKKISTFEKLHEYLNRLMVKTYPRQHTKMPFLL